MKVTPWSALTLWSKPGLRYFQILAERVVAPHLSRVPGGVPRPAVETKRIRWHVSRLHRYRFLSVAFHKVDDMYGQEPPTRLNIRDLVLLEACPASG